MAGRMRVKQGGGHGGHNGLRSIEAHLGADTQRIRLGIGHPGDKGRVNAHVLGNFSPQETAWVNALCATIADHLPILLANHSSSFQNQVHLAMATAVSKQ
jgi:PTH1 family peptidyl-tRNA hydrolase